MLEGLETIDWPRLRHAYGEASDLPARIRALASPDEETRREASAALFANIWHQGTVYEASAYAVPFLIELAGAPAVPHRTGILHLLHELATGSSYLAIHERGPAPGGEEPPETTGQRRRELEWVRAAHAAVVEGVPVYLRLLADPDLVVRYTAPYLLSVCEERALGIAPALLERLAVERDPVAKASIVLGFVELHRRAAPLPEATALALDAWRDALARLARTKREEPLVRGAAALALGELGGGGPEGDLAAVLVAMLPQMGVSGDFPWWGDRPLLSVAARAQPFPERRLELVLSLLRHADAKIRKDACAAVGSVCRERRGPEQALAPVLGELLSDPEPAVCEAAAWTLKELGPAAGPAREALLAILESGTALTRAMAAAALSKLGESRAAPGLVRLLEEIQDVENVPVRVAALDAARRLGPAVAAAVPVLRRVLLSDGDQVPSGRPVQQRAAAALGEIGAAAHVALPDLIAALQDPEVIYGAAAALARWGDAAVPAVPALCAEFERPLPSQRRAIAEALGAIGPAAEAAVPALEGRLSDEDGIVRAHAALALWRITGQAEAPVRALVRILEGFRTKQESGPARTTAAEHLALIGPPAREAMPELRAALESPSHWMEVYAARALWRVGGEAEAALPALRRHLRVDPAGRLALECLAEMGLLAAAAAPELRRMVESERRLP